VDEKLAPVNVVPLNLKGEQVLIRPLKRKTKNMYMAGGRKLKFTFYFMERTHELLHLDK
jgi:hypothetical protein